MAPKALAKKGAKPKPGGKVTKAKAKSVAKAKPAKGAGKPKVGKGKRGSKGGRKKGKKGKRRGKKKKRRCNIKRRKKALKRKCTNELEKNAMHNLYYIAHAINDALKIRKFKWKKKKK